MRMIIMLPNGSIPNSVKYNTVFDTVNARIKDAIKEIRKPNIRLFRTPKRSLTHPVVNPKNVMLAPQRPYAEPASVSLVLNSSCKYITNICDKQK